VLQTRFYDLDGNDSMGLGSREEILAWVNERRRPGTPRLLASEDPAFDDPYGWEFFAESVAQSLSVSLHKVDPHTTVEGISLLATPVLS
jgi:hypothetical protein